MSNLEQRARELVTKWRQNSKGLGANEYVRGMDYQAGVCGDELETLLAAPAPAPAGSLRAAAQGFLALFLHHYSRWRFELLPTGKKVLENLEAALAESTCIGYPECDGDLEGEPHSEKCPLGKSAATAAQGDSK